MKKVSIKGNSLGEIERKRVSLNEKEVEQVEFIIFNSRFSKYVKCIFYGNEKLNYRKGDFIYIFGSYLENEGDDFYRIFKVDLILRW